MVTQSSLAMACGVAMAANTQVSGLTAVAVTALLSDPAITDKFIHLNKTRIGGAYETMASFFRARGTRYIPAYAGVYIWAKLSNKVSSWDEEGELTKLLAEKQVAVSAGKAYAASEPGWYRLCFAMKTEKLEEGLERLGAALSEYDGAP